VKRRVFTSLVGSMAAASLASHAQVPARAQQTRTVTANLPQIEVMRVKPVEPADFRFRLRDGLVDLMKDFSLSSTQGNCLGDAGLYRDCRQIRRALRGDGENRIVDGVAGSVASTRRSA
jgi:hypothetical protein